MSDFENALHQGYTAADMAADVEEATQRMNALGCFSCRYGKIAHPTCRGVIKGSLMKCPYRKEA